jgi:hypothetical protein
LTYRNDVMSANWDGFFDKQSGIDMFQIAFSRAVVDENGAWLYDDVTPNSTINWLNLTGETIRISVPLPDDIRLEHNVVYHATIIAYNRGHLHLSNSSHSQGFLVDLTCPSFPLTRQTTFIAGFPPTDDPALRCMCPCPGCAFHPPELGDQCMLASEDVAFVYAGTNADLKRNNVTGVRDRDRDSDRETEMSCVCVLGPLLNCVSSPTALLLEHRGVRRPQVQRQQ